MAIYSGFSHEKWWLSIAMLVYQRVLLLHVQLHIQTHIDPQRGFPGGPCGHGKTQGGLQPAAKSGDPHCVVSNDLDDDWGYSNDVTGETSINDLDMSEFKIYSLILVSNKQGRNFPFSMRVLHPKCMLIYTYA
jgi:hypothetical protein